MFKEKHPRAGSVPQSARREDAVFKGWQKTSSGEVFALYNITLAGHPSLGSTVTDRTLRMLNLRVPGAPFPE